MGMLSQSSCAKRTAAADPKPSPNTLATEGVLAAIEHLGRVDQLQAYRTLHLSIFML
jgi:hypothetical protein